MLEVRRKADASWVNQNINHSPQRCFLKKGLAIDINWSWSRKDMKSHDISWYIPCNLCPFFMIFPRMGAVCSSLDGGDSSDSSWGGRSEESHLRCTWQLVLCWPETQWFSYDFLWFSMVFQWVFLWFSQWNIWWGLVFLGLIQNRLCFRERKHMWDCTVHFLSLPVCKASTPLLLRSVEPSLPIPRISVIRGFPRCWHRLQLSLAVPMSPMSC